MHTSITFLLLTIFIYCCWWSELSVNTAARTMIHYAINMVFFLSILALNYGQQIGESRKNYDQIGESTKNCAMFGNLCYHIVI